MFMRASFKGRCSGLIKPSRMLRNPCLSKRVAHIFTQHSRYLHQNVAAMVTSSVRCQVTRDFKARESEKNRERNAGSKQKQTGKKTQTYSQQAVTQFIFINKYDSETLYVDQKALA